MIFFDEQLGQDGGGTGKKETKIKEGERENKQNTEKINKRKKQIKRNG